MGTGQFHRVFDASLDWDSTLMYVTFHQCSHYFDELRLLCTYFLVKGIFDLKGLPYTPMDDWRTKRDASVIGSSPPTGSKKGCIKDSIGCKWPIFCEISPPACPFRAWRVLILSNGGVATNLFFTLESVEVKDPLGAAYCQLIFLAMTSAGISKPLIFPVSGYSLSEKIPYIFFLAYRLDSLIDPLDTPELRGGLERMCFDDDTNSNNRFHSSWHISRLHWLGRTNLHWFKDVWDWNIRGNNAVL